MTKQGLSRLSLMVLLISLAGPVGPPHERRFADLPCGVSRVSATERTAANPNGP